MSKITNDVRALAALLDSAERLGVPTPFSVSATGSAAPSLYVHTAADWSAWAAHVDPEWTWEQRAEAQQVWLYATAYECELFVAVVLDLPDYLTLVASLPAGLHRDA